METRTQPVIVAEQVFSLYEMSVQRGLDMKTLCALLKKHHDTGSIIDDMSRNGRPCNKATSQVRPLQDSIRPALFSFRLGN